ncbi:MAG: hypothetical protein ABL908_07920 [Hyphomicrobium sp.]
MWIIDLIPTSILYGLGATAAFMAVSAVFAVTRSVQATVFVAAISCVALGGWFYRDQLIAEGESRCAVRVEDATRALEGKAKTIVIDHSAEDKARIAELEAKLSTRSEVAAKRETARASVSIEDACLQCRIPRKWLRGQ